MSNEKRISLTFKIEQIANDVLEKCNLISQSIREEAMTDIKANVLEPDNPETRSIINRALTEAFGEVKVMCQRYLKVGRTIDNNVLERMVKSVTYPKKVITVQDMDDDGHLLFVCEVSAVPAVVYTLDDGETWKDATSGNTVTPDDEPTAKMVEKTVDDTDNPTITFEEILLELFIPNFNVAVTDSLKSNIHKFVVDYIMWRFLQDQLTDKAGEYKTLADGEDRTKIVRDLNTRDRFNMRRPSWV